MAALATTVRHVTPADRDAWLRLRRTFWPEASDAEHVGTVDSFLAGRARFATLGAALIALDGAGRAVGFAELSIRPFAEGCTSQPVAFLEGWYVVPEARRKGVGRALVAGAEAWARAGGFSELGSDTKLTNTLSAAAHQALGFAEVDQIRCFCKVLGDGRGRAP